MQKDALKVLFLNSWYPNRNAPTLGNFVQKHAEAVTRFEKVTCLSIFPDPAIQTIETIIQERGDLREIIIYFPDVKTSIPGFRSLLKWMRYKRAFELGMEKVHDHMGHIDLVHLNVAFPMGVFARILKRRKGIPYVLTEHSTAYHDPDKRFGKGQLRIIKSVLKDAEVVLPVSHDLGRSIAKLSSTPMERVTNVVDPTIFVPKPKEEQITLVHISTLNEDHKNPKGILRATKKVMDEGTAVHLKFISDFPADHLKAYADQIKFPIEHLSFLGPLETNEVAEELGKAHALILFSNYENFPCVIAEALMCGVPVISTNVNGIPEYVNDQNGILVSPKDEIALAHAIRIIAEGQMTFDPEVLRNYAIEHFSSASIGKQFSDVYHKTIQACGTK